MTLTDAAGGLVTVRPNPQTALWLDRSQLKLPNRKGEFADLRKDMVVEWIKAQAAE